MSLSARQERERAFYDQYASKFDVEKKIDFSPVISNERRPWNSYWSVYDFARTAYRPQACMLDFGSGPGDNALRFAKIGYTVEGFDISENNVALSEKLVIKNGLENKVHFKVAAAEKLPYADNSFDMIAGIDILHHVNIEQAIRECHRVMKPGGTAIFREPVEVPLLDSIRNTSIVRMIAPKTTSFERHITEDERKLNHNDLETILKIFPNSTFQKYSLLSRFDKFYREGSSPESSILEELDHALFALFPFLKYLGGVVILVLKK